VKPPVLPRPVVLLHGFAGSSRDWGTQIPSALRARGELLLVNLPGHEQGVLPSLPPPSAAHPNRFRFEAVLDALIRLLDEADVEEADWVGYSMGGRLALGAAVLHPTRVGRLVLESASPGLKTPAERIERQAQDGALAARIEAEGVPAFLEAWMDLPLFASQAALPLETRRAARALREGHSAEGLARALRGMGTGVQPSFWPSLGGMRAETLLLTGSLDGKFVAVAEEMSRAIPGVRNVTVSGVGHNVHLEDPEAWLVAVVPFLNRGLAGEPARAQDR
jgi:2-succinyl-6-hydroxy-2,4-cyclohexadiene-1-carboxylate synthase